MTDEIQRDPKIKSSKEQKRKWLWYFIDKENLIFSIKISMWILLLLFLIVGISSIWNDSAWFGFIFTLFPDLWFLNKIMSAHGNVYVECKIGTYKKNVSGNFGATIIHRSLLKGFTWENGSFVKELIGRNPRLKNKFNPKDKMPISKTNYKTFLGRYKAREVYIVEYIDWEKRIIYGCWFGWMSSWNFLKHCEGFNELKELVKTALDDIMLSIEMQDVHASVVLNRVNKKFTDIEEKMFLQEQEAIDKMRTESDLTEGAST